ncbi:Scr1 family TA system antitoxin-like transcriptional regulator [Streptomyces sp. B3I8]|uniref:Scr1 family TA system antitoxin-like transcriptional regulator n=1 Tax=Streptomyces sp. B3I8 TaxID=3042303 RepID=UPI0027D8A010|nr:Scr1 family TA system antitoxin-like transcriptional regulator [Streptomyces sp. B3I8]
MLRAEAGLTGAALAQRAGVGQPTVSKVETGRMVPSLDVLDRLLGALGLDESTAREVRDLLAAVATAADSGQPADNGAPVGAAVDEEVRSARLVRSFQCVILPAMLQSAEYARHVFEGVPGSTPEAVGRAVAGRDFRAAERAV